MAHAYKMLVVLTGGTIGSVCREGIRCIADDSPYLLLRAFRAACPDRESCAFDVINPYSILSENLTCDVWGALYAALTAVDASAYDGIIVTHGSDTLAYTAAAMGLLMRHTACPLVLTAADRPVDDPRSNAIPNFRAAVDFILTGGLNGVFVSYRRNDGAQAIYLATRLCSADCFRDEFSSYGGGCFGEIRDGRFVPSAEDVNPPVGAFRSRLAPVAPRDFTPRDKKILLLRAYPGLDYAAIHPGDFAAVVHYGYHCATACTEGEGTSLLRFARRCAQSGTDLWLGAFKHAEDELYASNRELLDAGVLPFYDMSPEAAYVKAVIAYHLSDGDPKAFMRRCVYFEIVGQPVSA